MKTKTRLYTIWVNMKQRCTNKNHVSYKYYGEVGISIDPKWSDTFTAFEDWAKSTGYQDNLEIDKRQVNGKLTLKYLENRYG